MTMGRPALAPVKRARGPIREVQPLILHAKSPESRPGRPPNTTDTMNLNDYQSAAMRTAKNLGETGDLMHAALGLTSEAGEFADAVKKHLVYGRDLDRVNAAEEVGDLLWFCALAARALGVPLADIAQANVEKLHRRYPDAYSDDLAAARLDKQGDLLGGGA